MIHVAKAPDTAKIVKATAAAMRTLRRLRTPSWPGLTRPSTSLGAAAADVDARVKPGHDEEFGVLGVLISPDAPRRIQCRCGHSARGCTYPRHRLAAARICRETPRA